MICSKWRCFLPFSLQHNVKINNFGFNSLRKVSISSHSFSCVSLTCEEINSHHSARRRHSYTQHRYFSHATTYMKDQQFFSGTTDRYNGLWIDLTQLSCSERELTKVLTDSLELWKTQNVKAVWLKVLLSQGVNFTVASKLGFMFHHAEGNQALLYLWMKAQEGSRIPRFATHQVGVSGMAIREDTQEVLVVKDKNRPFQLWKFPGGFSDLGEDIAATAEREVLEETGVKTEYQSVLAFRQQHDPPGAFGRSDLYVICRLKPSTYELHPCQEEIEACRWMSLEELKSEVQATSLTHRMAELVLYGLKHGFDSVDIRSQQMASLYKGLTFHIFHRPLKT